MPESDLSELVAGRSEDLGVEYKAWMETSQPEIRAKLARHIAALANHGGGYLIFGVDDKTRQLRIPTKSPGYNGMMSPRDS
jgi:predicted HTH transcriptional regulator